MRNIYFSSLLLGSVALSSAQVNSDPLIQVDLTNRTSRAIVAPKHTASTLVSFTVDPAPNGGDLFDVAVVEPQASVSLRLPSGVEVTASNAKSLGFEFAKIPAGGFSNGLFPNLFLAPGNHSIFLFPPNSHSGNYQVRINTSALAVDTLVIATFISALPVRAAVATAHYLYRVGDTVIVQGMLFGGSLPVSTADVIARIGDPTKPASTPTELKLLDSGPFDLAADDGMYTGRYNASTPGRFTIGMRATGNANGVPFSRLASAIFRVLPPLATFSTFSDNGVDADGDKFFEAIDITATIDVQLAGKYQFGMTLASSDGARINASTTAQLTQGQQQLVLSFSTDQVAMLKVDGPFQMLNAVLLYLDDSEKPLADSREKAGNTKAYKLSQLDRGSLFLTGQNSVVGLDTNANGKFDVLRIQLGVNASLSGTYNWSGTLVDRFRHEIDFFAGSGTLVAGNNVAVFDFSGEKIGQNGQNGPYFLRSVLIFGKDLSVLIEQALETPAFAVTAFENARCPGDLNRDGRVDKADLNVVSSAFGKRCSQPGFNVVADLNQDCVIDVRDLAVVSQSIGCHVP